MSALPTTATSHLTASNCSSSGPTENQLQQPQQQQQPQAQPQPQPQPQPEPQLQPQPQPQPQQSQQPPQGEPTSIVTVAAVGMDEAPSIGPQDMDVARGVEDDDDDDVPGLEDKKTKRGFSKRVTLRDLERYFEFPIEEVSKMMGVSTTIIKRLCRKYGIKRWPYRQIRSVNKSIKYVELLARTAMGPDRQRLQDQLVSLHYKKQLICQAATTGASAKVRKSILQMRPEDLDAETLLRSGGGHEGDGAESGTGVDETGSTKSLGHDGEDVQERPDIIGSMALEQQAIDAATAAAVAAAVQNPYAMSTHMPMAGMAMAYSPYVHMAAAAQAQQQAVAQHHQQVQQQKTGEGAAAAAAVAAAAAAVAAPGITGIGPSQMHPYSHLGLYGGYPGMLGMAYPFQAHAYPGMPGYGIQGMGGYPSLASGGSEHLGGMAVMQLAQTMQPQHIDLNQPQEIQQHQLLQQQQQQQLQHRQLQTQTQQAVMTSAAAAEVAAIDTASLCGSPRGEAVNGDSGGVAPEEDECGRGTQPSSGDADRVRGSTTHSSERQDGDGASSCRGGNGVSVPNDRGGASSAVGESNGKVGGDTEAFT